MTAIPYRTALIVGAGSGISAAVASALAASGVGVGLGARNVEKLAALAAKTGAACFPVDAARPDSVARLFAAFEAKLGTPEIVLYNASGRLRGALAELDPEAVRAALEVTAFGGFLVCREAARRMIPAGRGAILFTGASASVKGFARSAPFAMGKFALRGLAESAARELGPKGIHVAHFVIDGSVRREGEADPPERPESTLDPVAIASTYLAVLAQPRSAWSFAVELRPFVEAF
ncbi:MAG: SDR family NAD(P)-dependent oxidoreductase [Acetobacteraceae bacterium]